jgi:hypothetical protein
MGRPERLGAARGEPSEPRQTGRRPGVADSRSELARPEGLEPSTPGLEGRCSIQLSYGRVCRYVKRHQRPKARSEGSTTLSEREIRRPYLQ